MKKTVLALTTALLLAGGVATTASAKSNHNNGHHDRGGQRDSDRDGVPNRYDHNDRGVRGDNHSDRSVRHDSDHDGIANHWDQHDNRWDHNRFRYGQRNVYWAVRPYSGPRYVAPYGYRYHRWESGAYLPRGYYGDSYYVDYQPYGLPPPPYGYRWNRVGNDVYMVAITSGLISEVVYDLFH